jgi:NAD(P)-dependent dehydrogenase (short-subunit alcohol dehydrogenase family)
MAFPPSNDRLTQVLAIQVNYISTALLALLLLPVLKSSPSNPEAPVMTFVTTFGLYPASPFMGAPKSGSYLKHLSNNSDGMMQANQYGRSKGLLLYFARELASRVSQAQSPRVTINSADPGAAWTPLTNPNRNMLIPRLIMTLSAREVESGAKVMVNGVCSTEQTHGGILLDYDLWP